MPYEHSGPTFDRPVQIAAGSGTAHSTASRVLSPQIAVRQLKELICGEFGEIDFGPIEALRRHGKDEDRVG